MNARSSHAPLGYKDPRVLQDVLVFEETLDLREHLVLEMTEVQLDHQECHALWKKRTLHSHNHG